MFGTSKASNPIVLALRVEGVRLKPPPRLYESHTLHSPVTGPHLRFAAPCSVRDLGARDGRGRMAREVCGAREYCWLVTSARLHCADVTNTSAPAT